MINIGLTSYALGFIAWLVLGGLLLTGWRGRMQGGLLVLAVFVTLLWCGIHASWAGWNFPSASLVQAAEPLYFAAWVIFLHGLLGRVQKRIGLVTSLIYMLSAALFLAPLLAPYISASLLLEDTVTKYYFLGYVLLSIGGLFLVENLYRNTRPEQRWGIKFLCLGIGGVFAYDFFMYAQALLFNHLDMNLWAARGTVFMLVVPLIGIAVARNPVWSVDVYISRDAAAHTATLLFAGCYLLFMAAAGYYIREFGGDWGIVLQTVFLFGAVVVLTALLFSGQLRARIKVLLGKHFFRHRYDYREQWLRFTNALSLCKQEALPYECVVRAIAEVVDSSGGLLWLRRRDGSFEQTAHWGVSGGETEILPADSTLARFLKERDWVINLEEYRDDPELYSYLELPDWVMELPHAWLVVPLLDQGDLLGFMVVTRPRANVPFNWELRDLVKTTACQAASHLAQLEAMQALAEARQFEGFHRLSAFVLHDIKNLIAQQSLLIGAASEHKHKPEFIDDAVDIMEHSVAKMQRLMQLLKTGVSGSKPVTTNLVVVARTAVNNCTGDRPVPDFDCELEEIWLTMDGDRMTSVMENLIHNAQDATADDGTVTVSLHCRGSEVDILVQDNGCGMDADFIRDRLFRPFDTTKGDTGMGVGAYECKEYVNSLGGEIQIESEPGRGTRMHVILPLQGREQSVNG
ncbi:MAG: PEP-CTERM system histidine kinase PrsK, partial [Gammaproteobacteria bacterium]|nr:PEP-CTERM system histidine kinase PrsK [Gammaproteobacteria bacterium]